jgi:hypothetical protein
MRRNFFRLIVSAVAALILLPATAADTKNDGNAQLQSVLAWLPKDTEAIAVTSLSQDVLQPEDVFSLTGSLGVWQALYLRPLWQIADFKQTSVEPLVCFECVAASAKAGGANRTCQFLFVKENEGFDENWAALAKTAESKYTEGEITVLEIKPPQSSTQPVAPLYRLCRPKPGVIVGTTDKDLMSSILASVAKPVSTRVALPEDLREWKYAQTDAPCWGLRHFGGRVAASGFQSKNANIVDKQAIGMTFSYGPDLHDAQFTYLSENSRIKELAKAISGLGADREDGQSVTVKVPERNVCVMKVRLAKPRFPHPLWDSVAQWIGEDFPRD